jgi:hypothetical protein
MNYTKQNEKKIESEHGADNQDEKKSNLEGGVQSIL